MANRQTRLITKNSNIINRPLPSTLLAGEAIVNTADGIMWYSGVTSSTSGWTQSGTGTTATFFEVGSNLYDLRLRNKLTAYEGISGSGLNGKFLSGTTTGFVLADISSITPAADIYVSGLTYINNNLTIGQTSGGPTLTASINSMTGLTINGNISITGTGTANNLTITGTGLYNTAAIGANTNEIVNFSSLTAYTSANDTYVTGGTVSYSGPNGTITLGRRNTSNVIVTGFTDNYLTGATFNAGTLTLNNNNGNITVTGLTSTDTYVTGFTFTPASNTLTVKRNQSQVDLTTQITSMSGLSLSNLTTNRVVYASTGGQLVTGNAIFDGTNMTLPSTGSLIVGSGGLTIGSGGSPSVAGTGDLIVNGSLTVFGSSVSAFTSELYVEDSNITLNYNPTGNTTATSIGAGWTVQDGNGINGGNVSLDIRTMNSFTGLTASQVPNISEYTGSTGFSNRGFVTQLNDIVIRSSNLTTPNGVRVLAEFDILDGGAY